MSDNLKIVEVTGDLMVPFNWKSDNYGIACFSICPIWKRGKIIEIWAYPFQQGLTEDICWHWKGEASFLSITGYEGLDDPKTSRVVWCKEHKTTCIQIVSPPYAQYLWLHPLSIFTVGFVKTKFS